MPAETRVVKLVHSNQPQALTERSYMGMSINDTVSSLTKQGRIAVVGDIKSFQPGPQVGKLVPNLSQLRVVWFARAGVK
jgi:hypothetical protein